MKKIVSGAAVMVAAAGSLLVGTAAPANAYQDYYFGAIALSVSTGHIGYSYDYDDSPSAQNAAMSSCTYNDCKIVAKFANGCGAIAYSSRSGYYTFGAASSRIAAKNQALSRNSGDATIIHWNCTTGYEL
ncbi:DUF4189 domain-containing protein [Nocardia sp. CDC160]|uniref:DUF4189 domain-containing protein n=1 Tax=Nocardia sp. CDC160 TaxID=3112166 RepID=UPI002DB733C1|nr:DUF4189 domain-containing protein [Nocardia sp. CDC160]MEC3914780.1 DUF4189 domain-containing protein [Nocardia sp. CDC160]